MVIFWWGLFRKWLLSFLPVNWNEILNMKEFNITVRGIRIFEIPKCGKTQKWLGISDINTMLKWSQTFWHASMHLANHFAMGRMWQVFFLDWLPTKAKEPTMFYFLFIAGRKTEGFMPFPRALALHEMLTTLSGILTLIWNFISYDNKHISLY